jgi:lysophospholipase L1-like esterase
MVGDSITERSKPALEAVLKDIGFQDVEINAERSRRIEVGAKKPTPGLAVVKYIAGASRPDMWVIALGTNDAGLYENDSDYEKLIGDILAVIPEKTPLVWINTYRNDHLDGCEQFNGTLLRLLKDRGHATVGEWFQQCTQPDRKILDGDGVHPNEDGVLVFADTVRRAVLAELG